MVPTLILAGLLFYAFDNPPTGYALTLCSDLNITTHGHPIAPSMSEGTFTVESTKEPIYSVFDREVPLCIDEKNSLAESSASWWIIFLGW
jgi:hypothetical protein